MMSYAVENIATGQIVQRFPTIPASLEVLVDGHKRRVVSPVKVGDEGLGHRFIEVEEVGFARPGQYFHQGADTVTGRVGNKVTMTRQWTPWTQAEIDEQQRLDTIATDATRTDSAIRAAMLVILDEFNRHSASQRAILDAANKATSLADFKSRMDLIDDIPVRTQSDMLNALRGKLG
jgi:hypothetical protein